MSDETRLDKKKIPIIEMFGPTFQGEGMLIGQQTYFIRFGGCDYKCHYCDSLHAVDPDEIHNRADWLTQQEIFEKFYELCKPTTASKWVTLSGGNPAIHDLSYLCEKLGDHGCHIAVETQGTIYNNWLHDCDVVTVSPKTPSMERFDPKVFKIFMEETCLRGHKGLNVKVVVFNYSDLAVAKKIFEMARVYIDTSRMFLSQGNPYIPYRMYSTTETLDWYPQSVEEHRNALVDQYKTLFGLLKDDPFLSQIRFLPQLHVWVHGNEAGV